MPNPLNYGNPIKSFTNERMFRLLEKQQHELETGEKINLFGSNNRQNVELWFYNPDGTYAGNIKLAVADADLGLVTVPDTDGQNYEYLILNLEKIVERVGLVPSRYSVAISLYQDEVASLEDNNKLIITNISPSRTEVQLKDLEGNLITQIFEFVVPSVPRIYAKGLLDQAFSKSTGGLEPGDYLDVGSDLTWQTVDISKNLNEETENATARIVRSSAVDSYRATLDEILNRTYYYALDSMANDYLDPNVQSVELYKYIEDALDKTLNEMTHGLEVDPRFYFV